MAHYKPKELQSELNARIPRGSLEQNLFRARVWFWRQLGLSFDESVTKARAHIRRQTPGFEPRLRGAE
jgi:hypothetical protein